MTSLDLSLPPLPQTPSQVEAAQGGPLITQLPAAQASYARKYSDAGLNSYLAKLTPSLRNSLIQFDLQRVQRGQHPLSMQETLDTLKSYTERHPATPPEEPSFFGAALSDIGNIAANAWKIPFQLAAEVPQLPEAPGKLADVVSRGDFAHLNTVPGVRLIPGVNDISVVADEGLGGLLKHPVFSALDVLPYVAGPIGGVVESSLSRLPSVEAARAAELTDLPIRNAAREAYGLAPKEPASAARLALRENPLIQAARTSNAGTYVAGKVGQTAGDVVQGAMALEHQMKQAVDPNFPIEHVAEEFRPLREPAVQVQEWAKAIPEDRRIELTNRLMDPNEGANLVHAPDLTDTERGAVQGYVDLNNHLARVIESNGLGLNQAMIDGRLETLTSQQAKQLRTARAPLIKAQTLAAARSAVTEPTPGVLPAIDSSTIVSENLTRGPAIELAKGYAHALDAHGFDATPVFDAIRVASKDKSVPIDNIKLALDDTLKNPSPRPQFDASASLAPYARTDGSVAVVKDLIDRGDYRAALKKWRSSVGTRTKHVIPESDQILETITRGRDRQSFLNRTTRYTPQRISSLTKTIERTENRIAPGRFMPELERRATQTLRDRYVNDPEVTQLIDDGLLATRRDLGAEYAKILDATTKDAQTGWKAIRDAGGDPVFVHRVGQLSTSVTNPRLSDVYKTISSAKTRTGDMTPYVHDFTVAMSHQTMETLSRLGTDAYVERFLDLYGTTPEKATAEFVDQARAIAKNKGEASVQAVAQRLAQREYEKYDPAKFFPSSKAAVSTIPKEEVWIPKKVSATLDDMFRDHQYRLTSVFDPVMKVFRTAVLPLSPRWHINNIGGGAMLGGFEAGPRFFTNLLRARAFIKSGEYERIPGIPPGGNVSQPTEALLENYVKHSSLSDKVAAVHDFQGGQFLRKIADTFAPVTDRFGKVVEWSYHANQVVDDMYRAAGYLTGYDKALTKGLSESEATQAGVALVRKILPEWDRMTPMERTVMRSVFPFYSWAKFIVGYAYRFPIDHPFRVAVTASLARNEMNDMGDALPSKFMNALFLGHPDPKTGIQSTLDLSSVNPFRDVANYFTIAGFTGNLNPILQTMFQVVGVDPSKGNQSLYPDVAFDPTTGRLRASNPLSLASVAGNFIPQIDTLTALIGKNNEFKQILRSDPAAAGRMLWSGIGIPTPLRPVNPAQEAFKAELAREADVTAAKNEALKTGDYGSAARFPTLQAYFAQLQQDRSANPQKYAAFIPTAQTPATAYALQSGLVGS